MRATRSRGPSKHLACNVPPTALFRVASEHFTVGTGINQPQNVFIRRGLYVYVQALTEADAREIYETRRLWKQSVLLIS